MWVLFAVFYGILSGVHSVFKKKAAETSNTFFVLALSSTIGFFFVVWCAEEAFLTSWQNVLFVFSKAGIVALAWIFSLFALKNYYVSSLQPIKAIRVIISFVVGILVFNEPVIWWKFIGVIIIFASLISLNLYDKKIFKKENFIHNKIYSVDLLNKSYLKNRTKFSLGNLVEVGNRNSYILASQLDYVKKLNKKRIIAIIFFVTASILYEVSGIMDKLILNQGVTTNQMQFWQMFFVSVVLWICLLINCLIKKKNLIKKADWKNIFIYILPVVLIVGDRFLYMSLSQPDVLVSVVSVIKQLSPVTSIVLGGLWFKEPNLKYKLIFLAFVIMGIIIVII